MEAIPASRRWKIVQAVQEGESVAEVAERFAISETTVRNDLQRRAAGSLEPKPRSGGPAPSLSDADRQRLREAVDAQPDTTLAELIATCRLDGAEELPTLVSQGGTTTDRMLESVAGPLGAVPRPGDIVVADQLAAHKANRVAAALAERQAEIWLLPSYSPDLNPLERLRGKIKTTLRTAKARTVDRLQAALAAITNSDIRDWFRHSDDLAESP